MTVSVKVSTASVDVAATIQACAASTSRRRSTMSAVAPASRLSSTAGRLVAVCTAAISVGESDSDATTVTAPTLCIQMTTCDPSSEPQIARNTGRRRGAHAEPR